MPQGYYTMKEVFIRNWFTDPNARLSQMTVFPDSEFTGTEGFRNAGYLAGVGGWNPTDTRFTGAISTVWGAIGDGACRMKTREGVTGVMKQNWWVYDSIFLFLF